MVLRILFILLALGPMSNSLQAGWFDNLTSYFRGNNVARPPKVRILIVHDKEGALVEVKGKYKIHDPNNGDHISTRFVGKRKYMQAVRDGIKWGEEFPGVFQLLIVPDETSTTTVVDGIEYKGPIYIYDIGGTISIINEVSIEDFLSSSLAQKYKSPLPEEALNAFAIAARTGAYYASANPRNQYWSVDGPTSGYQGFAAIDRSSGIEKAIGDTRFMVMSNAAQGDEQINVFPAQWSDVPSGGGQQVVSKIAIQEAIDMANQGAHAAQILAKAFPGTKIELIHYPTEMKNKKR
jgi:stage II sporulation protein D